MRRNHKPRKDSSSPIFNYNQDAINIPIDKFKDLHSSIRYESQMGQNKYEFANSPYNSGAYHTISSQKIIARQQHAYSSTQLKTVHEDSGLNFTIENKDLTGHRKCISKDVSKGQSKPGMASNPDINERMAINQQQVAQISQKAREVSEQLHKMKDLSYPLPT